MNNSMKTLALTRMCVRQFTQTSARTSGQTEVASGKFAQLKEGQKFFGTEDHQLVHVKGGFTDKALYQLTTVLTIIGLGLSTETLARLTFKY